MEKTIPDQTIRQFKKWNSEKMHIHEFTHQKYAQQGQIWLCNLGTNIGSEQNGVRPCLVLNAPIKKEKTCVIVPASNTKRAATFKIGKYSFLLHQARTIDTKRLLRLMERVKKPLVQELHESFFKFFR